MARKPGNLREEHDDAVESLRKYVPGAGKTVLDLLFAGSSQIAAEAIDINASSLNQMPAQLRLGLMDTINGGKFTYEILNEMTPALDGPGKDKTSAEWKTIRDQLSRFMRITIPKDDLGKISDNVKIALINDENKYIKSLYDGNAVSSPASTKISIDTILPVTVDGATTAKSILTPSKENTPIVAYELLSNNIGINVRDTAPVAIGCSLMTPTAMSRCVPYLNARIFLDESNPNYVGGKTTGFNIVHFLRGPSSVENNPAYSPMVLSLYGGSTDKRPTPAGMELFTSPQTMISHHDDIKNFEAGRRPLDRFRPFMSITSFGVQVSSGGAGLIYNKTASMELVLYDRGRLAEISQLITPGLYSSVQIEIEYGWSAITGTTSTDGKYNVAMIDDDLVRFMNSIRVKEKFQVTTSSYKLDEGGMVSISLGLVMTGAADVVMLPIINDTSAPAAQEIKKALEKINQIFFANQKVKDIFGDTVSGAVGSVDYALTLDKKKTDELLSAVSKAEKASGEAIKTEAATVAAKLRSLFSTENEDTVSKYKQGMKEALTAKVDKLNSDSSHRIFPSADVSGKNASVIANKLSMRSKYSSGWVNLGSVFISMIASPIAATKKFDEIQVIFGRFNERAGFVRGLSIAAFPLALADFKSELTKLIEENVNVTPQRFAQMIADKFVDSPSNYAYGFSSGFTKNKDGILEFNPKTGQAAQDTACLEAGIKDFSFAQPRLKMYIETVPHISKPNASILRIHVIDETCTAYSTYHDVLWSARESDSFLIEKVNVDPNHPNFTASSFPRELDPSFVSQERTKIMESLIKAKVINSINDTAATTATSGSQISESDSLFTCNDPTRIRDYFKRTLPSITYGSMNGMINSVSAGSTADPQIATINVVNMDQNKTEKSPNETRSGGVPLQAFIADVTIEMLGNPMIAFAQEYFIDLGTNTTMDNIYVVTGLDHKLEPGNFTSSLKLTQKAGFGLYQSSQRRADRMATAIERKYGASGTVGGGSGSTSGRKNNSKSITLTKYIANHSSTQFYASYDNIRAKVREDLSYDKGGQKGKKFWTFQPNIQSIAVQIRGTTIIGLGLLGLVKYKSNQHYSTVPPYAYTRSDGFVQFGSSGADASQYSKFANENWGAPFSDVWSEASFTQGDVFVFFDRDWLINQQQVSVGAYRYETKDGKLGLYPFSATFKVEFFASMAAADGNSWVNAQLADIAGVGSIEELQYPTSSTDDDESDTSSSTDDEPGQSFE